MENDTISRFFIGIIPPEPVRREIDLFKQHLANKYDVVAALRSPPHLTLHMPFNWKSGKEERLVKALADFASTESSFKIRLDSFGCFEPRVIFVGVTPNLSLEGLYGRLRMVCRRELNLLNADYKDLPFHPHVTIAFRDFRKESFRNAWEDFRERKYEGEFPVERIVLLRHDGSMWDEYRSFVFKSE